VDLPFASVPALADRLSGVLDVEGKICRALDALGPLAGPGVAAIDVPGTPWIHRLRAAGADPLVVEPADLLHIPVPDGSLRLIVAAWTSFRGVAAHELAEVDRALAPGGRLLVVHDYGRDDVSSLRDDDAPEYRLWSRREGPFLRVGGFRIRVVHCFWTFASLEDAHDLLVDVSGERGTAVAERLKRPRLSWNVAVYHRWRGGEAPPDAAAEG